MQDFLDEAAESALDFLIARAAVMDHLLDSGSQIVHASFGLADIVLDLEQAFQFRRLGFHQGEARAVLVELTLEIFEFLQAVRASEHLEDLLATGAEGGVGVFRFGDLGAKDNGTFTEVGLALGEDAAVELDEIVVVSGELFRESELGFLEDALDIFKVEVDVVLQTEFDLSEVMAGVVEIVVVGSDFHFDGFGDFAGQVDFLAMKVEGIKGA